MIFELFPKYESGCNMNYNSKVDFSTIDKSLVAQERQKRIDEILSYGFKNSQIQDIIEHSPNYVDTESYSWDIILLNIAICELLWYNNLCSKLGLLKTTIKRRFVLNKSEKLPEIDENRNKNLFFSTLTSIVEKYSLDSEPKVNKSVA